MQSKGQVDDFESATVRSREISLKGVNVKVGRSQHQAL